MTNSTFKTASGQPYIRLSTSSPTPIFLTHFHRHDISTLPSILSIPSIYLNLIAIPQPYTSADAEWWVSLQMSGKSNLPLQVIRARDPEKGEMIGSVSLVPKNSEALQAVRDKLALNEQRMDMDEDGDGCECEMGYFLHPEWQGKRIMSAAVKALLSWGKEEMGMRNVGVRILEENLKSRAVVKRLGGMFVRCEKEDSWVDWPENKGGGRRRLLLWRWTGKSE